MDDAIPLWRARRSRPTYGTRVTPVINLFVIPVVVEAVLRTAVAGQESAVHRTAATLDLSAASVSLWLNPFLAASSISRSGAVGIAAG